MPVDFTRFAAVLRDLDVLGQVRELPESAPTAAAAAAQLGCELGAIANSLVFSADGAPLLVMTSGAHRVDTAKVASLIGASEVTRANARSVREWTGQAIGGVAPVGHPSPIRTLVDTWLDKYDEIWAAGGRPDLRPGHLRVLDGRAGTALAADGPVGEADRDPGRVGQVVAERPVSGQPHDRETATGPERAGHGGQGRREVHVVQRGIRA